jgi:hypothetical protein
VPGRSIKLSHHTKGNKNKKGPSKAAKMYCLNCSLDLGVIMRMKETEEFSMTNDRLGSLWWWLMIDDWFTMIDDKW